MVIVAKLRKRSAFTVYALIVLMGFLVVGFISSISMPLLMESSGQMTNCPFAYGEQSMCLMTLADHFSSWHKFWLAITPQQTSAIAFMLLTMVAGLLVPAIHKHLSFGTHHWRRYRWRLSYQSVTYLSELYSDGIVQPRLYA